MGDHVTNEIRKRILKDKDGPVNEIGEELDPIKQMGIQHFLSIQAGESTSSQDPYSVSARGGRIVKST